MRPRDVQTRSDAGFAACQECSQLVRPSDLMKGLCWICWSLQALTREGDK